MAIVSIPGLTRGIVQATTTITRPSNTTAYATGDALSNSTSAPTTGGFTLTPVVRVEARQAEMTDLLVVSSNPSGGLAGQIIFFSTAVTNINDNSAFAISDAQALTIIGIVPFSTLSIGNNSIGTAPGFSIGVPVIALDIRFLVRVAAPYTPISAETVTVIGKFRGVN